MRQSPLITSMFLLQGLPILLYPLPMIQSAPIAFALIFLFFGFLGFMALRGRAWALTLSIFCQGMNVIVRLMMAFPNAITDEGTLDAGFVVAMLLGIVLSTWLLFRMDRPDIRKALAV
jgi:hypothetical protein